MSLRDFFDLASDEPTRSKRSTVAEELSETSLFRFDTGQRPRDRDKQRDAEPYGGSDDTGSEFIRSPASGRFGVDPEPTPAPGVDRRRPSGRYIDTPQQDTDIGRDTETGRFVDRGDRR